MSETDNRAWPQFQRDSKSAAFFDAAARGELFIRRCLTCDQRLAPESGTCLTCDGTDLEWTRAEGTGSLVTWTVVERPPNRAFTTLVPYTIAVVELTEGPWLYTRLTEGVPTAVGQPVHVEFQQVPGGEHYPVFALTEGTPQ
jgi:uncharacterized OB-fold protein